MSSLREKMRKKSCTVILAIAECAQCCTLMHFACKFVTKQQLTRQLIFKFWRETLLFPWIAQLVFLNRSSGNFTRGNKRSKYQARIKWPWIFWNWALKCPTVLPHPSWAVEARRSLFTFRATKARVVSVDRWASVQQNLKAAFITTFQL